MSFIFACKRSTSLPERKVKILYFCKYFYKDLHLNKFTYPTRKFAYIFVLMNLKLLSVYFNTC